MKCRPVSSLLFLWSLGGATTALAAQPEDTTWRPEFTVSPVAREPAERARMSDDDLAKLGEAVSASPRLRQPRFDLVRALVERGDLVRAEAEAESWRQHDAYNLVAVRMLGDVQHARGEKAKARRTYSAIVELLPREVEARRALATVLKQVGDLDSARQQLSTALELGSSDPRTAFELGDVEQRLGSSEAAQGRFEEIAQAKDADESLRYPARQRLAQIYAAQRREAIGRRDDVQTSKLAESIRALDLAGGIENDIKVFLSWDTDRTDVDLWVTTPAGERVSYDHPRGRGGEALYRDVTTGYGPESFTVHRATPGEYTISVNFFGARGAFKEARGEVIVVVDEGRAGEARHVLPYRLFCEKDTVTVAKVRVAKGAQQ